MPEQAEKFRLSVFDLTKVPPQEEVPWRPFGKFSLNKNVEDHLAEIKQDTLATSSPSPLIKILPAEAANV